jgi:acyl-coenzyme A thioesterase 9
MRQSRPRAGADPATGGVPAALPPSASAISIDVPLSQKRVHAEYISYSNRLRLGKVMEDLDAVAGTVAFNHCGPSPRIVTAAVDAVDVHQDLPSTGDVVVQGRLTHVGRTSMEITATVRAAGQPAALRAVFLMAARDRESGKGWAVPQLDIAADDAESLALVARGERNREVRLGERSLPDLGLRSDSPAARRPYLESVFLAQPQQRNLASKIFGGYLIRRAVETAMCAAHIAAGPAGDPFILAIDEISFIRPVSVGDIVRLDAHVIFASNKAAVIAVEAWIVDVSRTNGEGDRALNFFFVVGLSRELPPSAIPGSVSAVGSVPWQRGKLIWEKARATAVEEKGLVDCFGTLE